MIETNRAPVWAFAMLAAMGCGDTIVRPECGEGTVEKGRVCVAEDLDDEGSADDSNEAEAEADHEGTTGADPAGGTGDEQGGSSSGTSGDASYYADCISGSDIECRGTEACFDDIDTCTPDCGVDQDCPFPSGGTAVPRCETIGAAWDYRACVLYCGDGFECPGGMTCRATLLCEFGWCTTSPTVSICVWR